MMKDETAEMSVSRKVYDIKVRTFEFAVEAFRIQ